MSSEFLASGENVLDSNLGGAWDITNGYAGRKQDLGIARRFGGAAAAYSLRDIGAMNGSVVRVRREPNDTTAGIDDEERFSANQVASGALEDWVNGKLETTLPADVATAAAAYSLRKVKASYSGSAVRIRRSSDDIEVDVAFDSDGKVSASSAITNVAEQGGESGSTTATDLNGFLNNEHTIDFEASLFQRVRFTRTDDQTIGGQIADKFEVNATGSNYYLYNNTFFDTNASGTSLGTSQSKQVLTFKYYVDSTESPNVNYFHFRTGAAGNPVTFNEGAIHEIVKDSWQTLTLTLDAGDSVGLRYYVFISNTSASSNASTMTVGEAFYLQDIPITYSEVTAFVHTWYDQAGSNNAVQGTAGNQPKIAENGALLADENGLPEIKFTPDASNGKFLSFTTINFSDTMGIFFKGVVQDTGGSSRTFSKDGSFTHIVQFLDDNRIVINTTTDATFTVPDFTTRSKLHTLLTASDSANYFGNAATADSPQAVDMNSNFQLNQIGTSANTSGATRADFDTSELIFYTSDQTDNRFKIESNINNYYGLYNDENEASDVFQGVNYSVTDATKTGFTIDIATATGVGTLPLVNAPDANETIYISYTLTINSGSPSINVVTQNRSGATITTSPDFIITEAGFYAHAITPTQDGATNLSFADDADNVNFTISDLKISRIARNGFVQTWYDQSGNGNNASRDTAANQPFIISNGNQVTLDNGTPSIAFERVTNIDSLSISTPLSNEPYTFFATTVNNASNAWFRLFGESNAAPTVVLKNNNNIVYAPSDSDSSGDISATTTSDNIVSGFSGVNGGADGILRFNGTNLKTDISRTQDGDSINLIGRFPNAGAGFAHIESLVFYESDLTADFDTIEKELAQPINIL